MSRERAWGWVAHLSEGGTTPWLDWQRPGVEHGRWLPGAQQLELLRRLNLAGRPSATLTRRVLEASAPGRGRPDLELVGADVAPRFGPSPVDPATLSDDELLRVACGLLAQDVVAAGEAAGAQPGPPARRRRPGRRHPRYRLAGDPELVASLRAGLVADGRPPGGKGAAVHVLGTDLATMLTHAWTATTCAEGGAPWPEFLAVRRQRPGLPPRLDLPAVADRWAQRPDVGRVDIVLDLPAAPPLAAHAAELTRRTAGALGLLVTPPVRRDLVRRVLRPRLAGAPGAPPRVPEEHRDWVEDRAARLRQRVSAAGYPVVGDLDALLPRWPARVERPEADPGTVLGLAVELLLEVTG